MPLLALAALLPVLAQTPAVPAVDARVSVDTSGPTTRVVVTAARPVAWQVAAAPTGLELVFAEPLRLDVPSVTLDDPMLRGWRLVSERRLQLQTGPAFTGQETFELRNPWRLVLDLQGHRPGGQTGSNRVAPATVIVLDPGHGGVETGAVGPNGVQEKEVVLDLARRLQNVLQREPGVAVVLTRDEDRQVARDERTAIANQNRAELFVSLHLNSSPAKGATGAETYFLSAEATDDAARTLAGVENEAARRGEAVVQTAAGGGQTLDLILWDLAQNQYLAESARLAEAVQRELNALAGTKDRGVRQAPFTVLMGATMPAILVELGFVSNASEESRLKDSAYRDRIVEALARAIQGFRQRIAALQ
ncbi:MAG TPA: N-acetylmuramoyl-L-alanine amidase [Candidatus Polarisedimenticolaceae bacterium]|nr:N-acetylmuramoyl-L-alanine amidase [Candidatus Polarisedimenticolaceae bacterium]